MKLRGESSIARTVVTASSSGTTSPCTGEAVPHAAVPTHTGETCSPVRPKGTRRVAVDACRDQEDDRDDEVEVVRVEELDVQDVRDACHDEETEESADGIAHPAPG